jgi:hypothetical protein
MVILTYMSIHDAINCWIKQGRLFVLTRALPSDPVERTMLISPEIKELVDGPWQDTSMERRCGRLRADLEAFIGGDIIPVCLNPFEAKTAYFGRLHPASDGIFDIRSRDPSPALRVFGAFAETDTFVALTWSPRSRQVRWTIKRPLGPRGSRAWRDAVVGCKTEWKRLFPTYPPVTGDRLHDYISQSVVLV